MACGLWPVPIVPVPRQLSQKSGPSPSVPASPFFSLDSPFVVARPYVAFTYPSMPSPLSIARCIWRCIFHLLRVTSTASEVHYASHCICACLHNRDTYVAESELPNSSRCVVVGLAGTATKTIVHIINMSTMGEPRVRGERRECQCALDRTVLRSRQRSS